MESVALRSNGSNGSKSNGQEDAKRKELENFLPGLKTDDHDKLDLATLLNVLDGVRETPGRIIILSTNHPERLDDALLRPGRFDLVIHFKKHDRTILKQHVAEFYDAPLTEAEDHILSYQSLDNKWTPAEVSQILFKHIEDRTEACRVLVEEDPAALFSLGRSQGDMTSLLGLSEGS